MNKIDFTNTGGFPLSTNILDELQNAYSLFNELGNLSGDLSIISGCVPIGNKISDGTVYISGELLHFKGSIKQSTVIVKEDIENRIFEDGIEKPVVLRRYVVFGSGPNAINWSLFQRPKNTLELTRMLPVGIITMWSGLNVPIGWKLCDGKSGTPDLRGKFIVGLDSRDDDYKTIGKTGGAKKVAITVAEMPSHDHTGWTYEAGSHTHKTSTAVWKPNGAVFKSGTNAAWELVDTEPAGVHSHEININAAGNGTEHENRPPFYTLAYIIYVGEYNLISEI